MTASLSVSAPLQERSVRTFDTIMDATERLLEAREFDSISVADIVREAGVSTGSFYARLSSKDALLPLLYRRYHLDIAQRGARLIRQIEAADSLAVACHLVVEPFIWLYTSRANLMRAVTLLARTNPEAIEEFVPERMDLHRAIERAMLRFDPEIRREDPQQAIRLALFMAVSTLREGLLFGNAPFARATAADANRLRAEVVAMMSGYLSQEPGF